MSEPLTFVISCPIQPTNRTTTQVNQPPTDLPSPPCPPPQVGSVIKQLLQRLATPQLDEVAGFCAEWLEGGVGGPASAQLRRAAAQALGIMVEVEGARFGQR